MNQRHAHWIGLSVTIVMVAAFFRFQILFSLNTVNPHIDHVSNAACAKSLFFERRDLRDVKWSTSELITTGLPVLVPVGLALKLAGLRQDVPRLAMVVLNTVWVVAFIFALRPYRRIRLYLGATLALAAVPLTIFLWDRVMGEISAFLMLAISISILPRAGRARLYFFSGVLAGLAVATKLIVIFSIPALLVYLAKPLVAGRDSRSFRPLLAFLGGMAAVGLSVVEMRVWLVGDVGLYEAYARRFFGGFVGWTSGIGPNAFTSNVTIARKTGGVAGAAAAFFLLSLGGWAARKVWKSNPDDHAARDFSFLMIASAILPVAFWLFVDPWYTPRRIYPALFCGVCGLSGLISLSGVRALRWIFVFLLVAALPSTWLVKDWSDFYSVPRVPTQELIDFSQARDALGELLRKDGSRQVAGYHAQMPPLFRVSPLDFDESGNRFGSRPQGRFAIFYKNPYYDEWRSDVCPDAAVAFENATFRIDRCGEVR